MDSNAESEICLKLESRFDQAFPMIGGDPLAAPINTALVDLDWSAWRQTFTDVERLTHHLESHCPVLAAEGRERVSEVAGQIQSIALEYFV